MITIPSNYPSAIKAPPQSYCKPPSKEIIVKINKKLLRSKYCYTVLTPRIKEVLILKAQGFSHRRIAKELGLHVKTIEKHVEHGYKILGFHNTVALVHYALQDNWIKNKYTI